jgi:exopolysaccharide production protein ExoQ
MTSPANVRPTVPGVMIDHWWLPLSALLLIVASDYAWRVRDPAYTLSGRPDVAVLIELGAYVAVGAFLVVAVLEPPGRARPDPLLVTVWGFSVTAAVSAIYAPTPMLALARGGQLLVACLLCQAVARQARGEQFHRLVHSYIGLCVASVLVGLAVSFPPVALEPNRFNFLYVHPVGAGTILGLGLVCVMSYLAAPDSARTRPIWPRWAYAGASLWIGLGLVLTITRSAITAAMLAIIVMLVVGLRNTHRVDLLVFGPIVVVLTVLLAGARITDFLARGQTPEQVLTLNSRTILWEAASEHITARPFLGHGLTSARSLFIEDLGLGGAHNAAVEVAVSNGLVGLAWWLGILTLIVVGLIRLRPRGNPATADVVLLSGLVTFLLVNGITTEGMGEPANVQSLWLFLVAGWVVKLLSDERRIVDSGMSDVVQSRDLEHPAHREDGSQP